MLLPRRCPICWLAWLLLIPAWLPADAGEADPAVGRDAPHWFRAVREAHGGEAAWQALHTLQVLRLHQLVAAERPWEFRIDAEFGSQRVVQHWQQPAGLLAWDGERAWSVDWPLADALKPRFVAAIGIYLIGLPRYLEAPHEQLQGVSIERDFAPGIDGELRVLQVDFRAAMTQRPAGLPLAPDRYEVALDPHNNRIRAVRMHWRYAGQLGPCTAEACREEIIQLFVPDSWTEVEGVRLPLDYRVYDGNGQLIASGHYRGYRFNQPFPEALLQPPAQARFDTSSSYLRPAAATPAQP